MTQPQVLSALQHELVHPGLMTTRDAVLFWLLGFSFALAEYVWPSRRIRRRAELGWNVLGYAWTALNFYVVAVLAALLFRIPPRGLLLNRPSYQRLLILLIVSDFTIYWSHRLRHTTVFWRIHRWHHSSQQLHWLSSVRTTLLDYLGIVVVVIIASWVMSLSPAELAVASGANIFANLWMHANVSFGNGWIERLIVTPRFHRVHHGSSEACFNRNFGSILSCWDHLFGTFADPDVLQEQYALGIPSTNREKVRMIIGI